jgi:hypothetical protein
LQPVPIRRRTARCRRSLQRCPPVAPSVLTLEDQEMLRPRSVNTLPASLLVRPN